MNLLSLLDGDLVGIAKAIATGDLDRAGTSFKNQASVCKYMVPLGYPVNSVKTARLISRNVQKMLNCF